MEIIGKIWTSLGASIFIVMGLSAVYYQEDTTFFQVFLAIISFTIALTILRG